MHQLFPFFIFSVFPFTFKTLNIEIMENHILLSWQSFLAGGFPQTHDPKPLLFILPSFRTSKFSASTPQTGKENMEEAQELLKRSGSELTHIICIQSSLPLWSLPWFNGQQQSLCSQHFPIGLFITLFCHVGLTPLISLCSSDISSFSTYHSIFNQFL